MWHAADASADAFLDCCRRDSIIVAAEMWSHTDKANTHVDSCNVRYRRFRMGLPTPGLPTLLGEAGRGCHTYRGRDRQTYTYRQIYLRTYARPYACTPARLHARPRAMHTQARAHAHTHTQTVTPSHTHTHVTPTPHARTARLRTRPHARADQARGYMDLSAAASSVGRHDTHLLVAFGAVAF